MILVGISPDVAQTIVQLGINVSGLRTFSTLQTGFQYAQSLGQAMEYSWR